MVRLAWHEEGSATVAYSWTVEGIHTSTGHLGQTGLDGHWADGQGVWVLVLDLSKAIIEQLKAKQLEEAQTALQARMTGCPIHLQFSGMLMKPS